MDPGVARRGASIQRARQGDVLFGGARGQRAEGQAHARGGIITQRVARQQRVEERSRASRIPRCEGKSRRI